MLIFNLCDMYQGQLWRKMVDPRKCPGDRPMRIRECNRIPCPAKWVSTGTVYCAGVSLGKRQ